MKVQGPSGSQKTSKTKKASQTSTGDGSFGSMLTSGAKESSGVSATQSIAKVDALLAVQGVDDPAARAAKQRMRQRGEQILGQLDRIRMGLLSGNMTMGQVLDIADVVASHREKVNDPELTAILDEIDLRAQIEIAKMKKAMESKL